MKRNTANSIKIAIVYDWLDSWGGVERVLLAFHEMFPQADFFTSYYDPKKAQWAKVLKVHTSFIQQLPGFIKKNRKLSIPFYPFAFESFDFKGYDVVLSVSSSFAKGVLTRPETKHICYLLTPTRFLWSHSDEYGQNSFMRRVSSPVTSYLRSWDSIAAQRPDTLISISNTVADRCRNYYRRDSEVIYPPFDTEYWTKIKNSKKVLSISLPKKYFLVVSRLEAYKKVDLVIKTFNKRPNDTLVVVGQGREEGALRSIAHKNIHFIKHVSDEDLGQIYGGSEALIMAQEEDFGYVSLEAQFFGCPVIAYKAGGALETVIPGKTGVFFDKQTIDSLQSGLEKHHTISYNIRTFLGEDNQPIEKFSRTKFVEKITKFIFE